MQYLFSILLIVSFLFPSPAQAADGFDGGAAASVADGAESFIGSFGGMVLAIIPCVGPYGGSYVVEVGGLSGGSFIWTPFTLTYMYGPPLRPGQYIIGLNGLPATCPTAIRRGVLTNWRSGPGMIMIGTSL